MYRTIRDLLGNERLRLAALSAASRPKKASKPDDAEMVEVGAEEPQLPGHEIDADSPTNMHTREDAQAQYNFLKQAFGGPSEGFVTRRPHSHQIALKLVRSGHLAHVGEKKDRNGHATHHWRLTPKGVAVVGGARRK